MTADGGGQHRIVAGKDVQNPAWSPDGKRLVFCDGRNDTIFSVSPVGSGLVRLTRGWHPVYSPDGSSIAFSREVDGTETLMVYDIARKLYVWTTPLKKEPKKD